MGKSLFSPIRTKTLSDALANVHQCISSLSDTPGLDAHVLMAHICKKNKTWLYTHPEYVLTDMETLQLAQALAQLSAGVPLPYVIGEWEFFCLKFRVTPAVLIPRPETELLVETALEWLAAHPERNRMAEAGTGSGCIAISMAVNQPRLEITATDISANALAVASSNARRHNVDDQIKFVENNLLEGIPGPFDLICANLPYIPTNTLHTLPVYKSEPTLALDGGPDGLVIIDEMLAHIKTRLAKGGLALLEIESGQGKDAVAHTKEIFPDAQIQLKQDLAGHNRLLMIQI